MRAMTLRCSVTARTEQNLTWNMPGDLNRPSAALFLDYPDAAAPHPHHHQPQQPAAPPAFLPQQPPAAPAFLPGAPFFGANVGNLLPAAVHNQHQFNAIGHGVADVNATTEDLNLAAQGYQEAVDRCRAAYLAFFQGH